MIRWTAKNPEERLDYYWKPPLDAGDNISTFTIEVVAGTVAVDDDDFTADKARAWLSGGAAGETAVFELTVETDEGRIFKETARLDVVASDTETTENTDELKANLDEARKQYHLLATGQAASAFVDQNGERVQFVKADLTKLYSYIQELERKLAPVVALTPQQSQHPRPMRFLFGRG